MTVAAAQDAAGRARGTIRNVRERVVAALALGLAAAACGAAAGRVERGPRIAGCPVFPASNAWNRDVSRAPVHPRSDAYVRSIGSANLHPDFAARRYGIPVTVVPRGPAPGARSASPTTSTRATPGPIRCRGARGSRTARTAT